jgi:hypothetical protein
MKLVIADPVSSKNPKDAYVLTIKLYYGDADGYLDFVSKPIANNEFDLEDLYTQLKMVALVKEINDKGTGDREYNGITGFQTVFPEWPHDEQYAEVADYSDPDDYRYASYDGHYVRYFDANGTEFQVKIED